MHYGLKATLVAGGMLLSFGGSALAAEGGVGAYLLGGKGPMAGFTPPEGLYFQDDMYFYAGKIGAGRALPTGGLLTAGISAQSWLNLPTLVWVTPAKVLGGDLAVSVTTPFGEPRINANLLVHSPGSGPSGET